MKKNKCELCTKNKAKRKCEINEKYICPLCCANLRSPECEGCPYFQAAKQYHSSKPKKSQKKQVHPVNE